MGKIELSTRSQDSTSFPGLSRPCHFLRRMSWGLGDEARSDCGRDVVHVHAYEKYFILAIKIIFWNLNSV